MRVQFDPEEARALTAYVADCLIAEAGLSAADAAALRKWRASMKPGSAAMRELEGKINADIARVLENKRKSAVLKPDWR
jgi:hypothetical protein